VIDTPMLCRRAFSCAAFLAMAACQRRDAAPAADTAPPGATTCGVNAGTALTGDGLGDLRIGAAVDQVARNCRVLRDTTALGIEGEPERTILIDLERDSVTAVVSADKIWRVHVRTPAFRTADSLGVGTAVTALQNRRPQILTGEGKVFVRLPTHCGLSFRLGGVVAGRTFSLELIPESVVVDEVLAFGC
jgi:hypothetical protein